jgi:hypothetical protein
MAMQPLLGRNGMVQGDVVRYLIDPRKRAIRPFDVHFANQLSTRAFASSCGMPLPAANTRRTPCLD